jgi:hypothetical protein
VQALGALRADALHEPRQRLGAGLGGAGAEAVAPSGVS